MRNTKSSVKSIPDVSKIDRQESTGRSLECSGKDLAEWSKFRWENIFSGLLKMLCLLVEEERSVGLWCKNLKREHETSKDHENPDCPSPADSFSNVATDNRAKNRSDKRTDQEDRDTDNLFKSTIPHLYISQAKDGIIRR